MSRPQSLKAAKNLVQSLEKLGINGKVQDIHNNEWLAQVQTMFGPIAVYTNSRGKVTLSTQFIKNNENREKVHSILDIINTQAVITPVDSQTWVAYTDGSAKNGQCGWAAVLFNPSGKKEYEKFGNLGPQPNSQIAGEVEGALNCIRDALSNKLGSIRIRHDYEGVGRWGDGSWKNTDPDAQRLKRWVAYAKSLGLKIQFEWTRGHNGDAGNERADFLASKATLAPPQPKIKDPITTPKSEFQVGFDLGM